jgi:hypothetical protein
MRRFCRIVAATAVVVERLAATWQAALREGVLAREGFLARLVR